MEEKQWKIGEWDLKGVWKWRRWVEIGDGGGGDEGIAGEKEA